MEEDPGFEDVVYEKAEGIAKIINRPEVHSASAAHGRRADPPSRTCGDDASIGVAILAGTGTRPSAPAVISAARARGLVGATASRD